MSEGHFVNAERAGAPTGCASAGYHIEEQMPECPAEFHGPAIVQVDGEQMLLDVPEGKHLGIVVVPASVQNEHALVAGDWVFYKLSRLPGGALRTGRSGGDTLTVSVVDVKLLPAQTGTQMGGWANEEMAR